MSNRELNTLAALISNIWEEQGRKLPILGHKDIVPTDCPGRYYSQLDKIYNMAEKIYNKKSHVTGWQKDKIGIFYTYTDGSFPVSAWKYLNNKWYYFDDGGYAVTGWKQVDGKWYYMNSNGEMQTGWITVKGKKYYMASNGVMNTATLTMNGSKYYFDKNGALYKTESVETKTENRDYVNYKVIVEQDETQPEGTSGVKVAGVKGYTVSQYSRNVTKYESGKAEAGSWKETSKKVVPPVDEIRWEGTKKAEPVENQ